MDEANAPGASSPDRIDPDATNFFGEIIDIDEVIGLTTQFLGDYRRLRPDRRNDGYAHAFALNRLDERSIRAIARYQSDRVDTVGHRQCGDREIDVDAASGSAATEAVDRFRNLLRDDDISIMAEPIGQPMYRPVGLRIRHGGVVEGLGRRCLSAKQAQKPAVVEVDAETADSHIEICAVDEYRVSFEISHFDLASASRLARRRVHRRRAYRTASSKNLEDQEAENHHEAGEIGDDEAIAHDPEQIRGLFEERLDRHDH
ncbi:MAG TPA: hypothetical protein VIF40_17085 [Methylosinus sp.]